MKILFVCLGNICRSPMAEGILLDRIHKNDLSPAWEADSAGFEPFHTGDAPDNRAIYTAGKKGVDLSPLRARLFHPDDFDYFDKIFVMDHKNYRDVIGKARNLEDQKKVDYILNLLNPGKNQTVTDPWYGDIRDFENVYQLLEKAIDELIRKYSDS